MNEQEFNLYRYKAVNNSGQTVTGTFFAADENHLYAQLQDADMTLVKATITKPMQNFLSNFWSKKIPTRELIRFYIQLSRMQKAGIPLLEALFHSRLSTDSPALRDTVIELHRRVSEGLTLSKAMEEFPSCFNNLQITIVRASEKTGDMVSAYEFLIKYLKSSSDMERRIKKATRYPTILLVALTGVVIFLLGFVVPKIIGFVDAFSDGELPFATTSLMAVSSFCQTFGLFLVGAIILGMVAVKALRKASHSFRHMTDGMILKLPVLGEVFRKIEIARFAYVFSVLQSARLPLIKSIKEALNVSNNMVIRQALKMVHKDVLDGTPMSKALSKTGQFPNIVIQMFKLGEESGEFIHALNQVSEFYNDDIDDAVDSVVSMIEPALTIIMAGMILWIAVAVFGPIYGTFENIDF